MNFLSRPPIDIGVDTGVNSGVSTNIDQGARRRRVRVAALAALAVTVGVGGCSFDLPSASNDTETGTDVTASGSTCAATVRQAAYAIEVAEQVELLDAAIVDCGTVDELAAEINKYPGFSGYTTPFLITQRCETVDVDDVRNSEVCLVAAPTTTLPPALNDDIVFTGETLDGRQVELRPSPDLPFIDDAPAEIKRNVDVAIAEGCDGIYNRRDYWYAAYENSGDDAASVFAQHAKNVAKLLNCAERALPTGEDSSSATG